MSGCILSQVAGSCVSKLNFGDDARHGFIAEPRAFGSAPMRRLGGGNWERVRVQRLKRGYEKRTASQYLALSSKSPIRARGDVHRHAALSATAFAMAQLMFTNAPLMVITPVAWIAIVLSLCISTA